MVGPVAAAGAPRDPSWARSSGRMLFNSLEFILAFLPVTLIGFFLLGGRDNPRLALGWLTAASLFFYGWWNPAYLVLIVSSIVFNYMVGQRLMAAPSRGWLTFGVAANLASIGYFKYAGFLTANLEEASGLDIALGHIVLPLAISFFTFQQIAYLVDAYRGEVKDEGFVNYALFVTFFPQLIAGPIVHHSETMPQFAQRGTYRLDLDNLAVGLSIFSIGLFKKVVLADGIAAHATPVFDAAGAGYDPTLFEAWGGALSYTFQLYFDFSGYSDMAIGLARMFNIRLPINFDSPYKAVNIIDFWRRWHITLSRFLRDYLYIPLGGSRHGVPRRYSNLMITMLLGGLWHGAGWTFVVWGGLHGVYLVINHAWHAVRQRLGHDLRRSSLIGRIGARTVTFLAVVVAWVFFRAESFDSAGRILAGMVGLNGVWLPGPYIRLFGPFGPTLEALGWRFETFDGLLFGGTTQVAFLLVLGFIAFLLPNTQQWVGYVTRDRSDAEVRSFVQRLVAVIPSWRPTVVHGSIIGLALCYCLLSIFAETPSEFLYFQF
jgi:alginate O-acetyltransferase complex protein AlgI